MFGCPQGRSQMCSWDALSHFSTSNPFTDAHGLRQHLRINSFPAGWSCQSTLQEMLILYLMLLSLLPDVASSLSIQRTCAPWAPHWVDAPTSWMQSRRIILALRPVDPLSLKFNYKPSCWGEVNTWDKTHAIAYIWSGKHTHTDYLLTFPSLHPSVRWVLAYMGRGNSLVSCCQSQSFGADYSGR